MCTVTGTVMEMGVVKGDGTPLLKRCFLIDKEVKVASTLNQAVSSGQDVHALHRKLHVQGGG